MTSKARDLLALLLSMAAAASLVWTPTAAAQSMPADDDRLPPVAQPVAAPAATDVDTVDRELDWSQLSADASTLSTGAEWKLRAARPAQPDAAVSWSSSDKPNGSTAVTAKQPLSSFWDARVGADLTVAREPATLTESQLLAEKLANGGNLPQSSGTAWAAISAPGVGSIWDKTAVEARVDPAQETGKLGTSVSKSLPLDEQVSLTLQNGADVIQPGLVVVPGIAARPARSYDTAQSARLSIADSGTTLVAGQTLSSGNEKWLHHVGAEQKLSGGLSVKGAIGETPQGTSSKSVSFGFNQSW